MLAIPTQNKRRGGGKKKEEENHSDVHCEGANEITQGFSLDRKQDDQWRHHQDFLSTLGRGYRRLAETSRAGSKSDHREISPLLTGQRVAVQIYLQSFSKFARRGRKDVEIFSDAGVEESQDFKKEVLDWELQHLLDVMLPSGDLVLQLINDILDLSKVDSGVIKLEATKFRPREVIKHDLQTVAASLRKFLVLEGT